MNTLSVKHSANNSNSVSCLFSIGADDPCRFTYCGLGTCNNATGECDCPEGLVGPYCQYQEGGEPHPLHTPTAPPIPN